MTFCSDGILAAYYHSLYNVQLYGPTNFAPVIRHVARFAQVSQQCSLTIIFCHGEEGRWHIVQSSRIFFFSIFVQSEFAF
jgi:hypothetical protein